MPAKFGNMKINNNGAGRISQGAEKMAAKWEAALLPLLEKDAVPQPGQPEWCAFA